MVAQMKVLNSIAFFLVVCLLAGCATGGGTNGGSTGGGTEVPAVPAGLVATAGNAQVNLSWAAVSGSTSYHVKRATTGGGPYTQVAVPTSASFIDSGLTNGTTYYYVVSAVNSAGESANSAQASAEPVAPAQVPTVPVGLVASA